MTVPEAVTVVSLAERPDLIDALWTMPQTWPTFVFHSPVGERLFARLPEAFPDWQLLALGDGGAVVGKLHSAPFCWSGAVDELPDRGWEAVLEAAFADRERGRAPTAVSLLEAFVTPSARGTGLSSRLLRHARHAAGRQGLRSVVAPVRPVAKDREPRTPMVEYAARVRADGLPTDPWLRVHARLGGRIVKICPLSMTVVGTLAQWRSWTGLPLARSGPVAMAGGLTPLHVSVEHDHAVYVEPNVWVHHDLAG